MTVSFLTLASLYAISLHNNQTPVQVSSIPSQLISLTPKIFAHRAGSLEGKENSLSAIKQVTQLRVDGIFIDTRRSKNNKFVLVADENLLRLTGQNKRVDELHYPDDFGYFKTTIETELNEVFEDASDVKEKPAELEEVLDYLVDKNILIMVCDQGTRKDLFDLLSLFKKKGLLGRLIIQTDFDKHEIRNNFGYSLSITRHSGLLLGYYTAFFSGEYFEFPERIDSDIFTTVGSFETISESPVFSQEESAISFGNWQDEEVGYREFFDFVDKHTSNIKLMNRHLNLSGKPVIYSLVNKLKDFRKAVYLGANAILTDRPAEMMIRYRYLIERFPYRHNFYDSH